MRWVLTALALALCLLGCGAKGEPMELLTGSGSCYAGAQHAVYAGVLVPDLEYGTRIEGKGPVIWYAGTTGLRQPDGGVVVLNSSGREIARTGKAYAIAPVPHPQGREGRLVDELGAIPAFPCYSWDFKEVVPRP